MWGSGMEMSVDWLGVFKCGVNSTGVDYGCMSCFNLGTNIMRSASADDSV